MEREGNAFSEHLQTIAGQEMVSLRFNPAPRLAHQPGCSVFAMHSQIQEITQLIKVSVSGVSHTYKKWGKETSHALMHFLQPSNVFI